MSDVSSVIDLSFFSKEEELKRRQQRVDAIDLLHYYYKLHYCRRRRFGLGGNGHVEASSPSSG